MDQNFRKIILWLLLCTFIDLATATLGASGGWIFAARLNFTARKSQLIGITALIFIYFILLDFLQPLFDSINYWHSDYFFWILWFITRFLVVIIVRVCKEPWSLRWRFRLFILCSPLGLAIEILYEPKWRFFSVLDVNHCILSAVYFIICTTGLRLSAFHCISIESFHA